MDSKFYVSLKTAMLLREKGYDIKRDFLTPVYNENGCLYWSNHEDLSDKIPAITKDEAIDWLESKGIVIEIHYRTLTGKYFGEIHYNKVIYKDRPSDLTEDYKTRLEAKDATIIQVLKLL